MPRTYSEPSDLTEAERIVLRRLYTDRDTPLKVADFANVATCNSGKREWANAILKRLETFELVDRTPGPAGQTLWDITDLGVYASDRARPAPPELGDKAKAMLLGPFLNPRATLRFENESKTPSPEAREGMRELVFEGLATEEMDGKAEIWRLNEKGCDIDKKQLVEDIFGFMSDKGCFRLAVPIEPEDESLSM
ncbi:MAG: hypothetical protein ABJN42_26965 [Roseibium sp.]|uniref:hypothetical protein n=1 Tax=Roseibium sp. TaxID=1936156 RepID=UPI0032979F80